MPMEGVYLFSLLLGSVGLLVAAGIASLWAGRKSERCSVAIGAGGAITACGMGLSMAIAALALRFDDSGIWPWSMPYGEFRFGLDPLSAFFLIPLFLLSGLAAVYSIGYFRPWKGRNPGRFWFFYNGLVASMAVVLTARNGVLFLVAWEAMSLSSFFLVVFDDEDVRTLHAGWVYLVATHIGTAFLLALFLLLGRAGGSQDFGTSTAPEGMAGVLFLLALIGFGTKAGLFPLHVWLPEAHPAAPSPVSAVMSGVMIKTGIYGIVRTLDILGVVPGWCAWLVLGVGAASGILGILFALAQQDIKRMLAYSSVENIGIIAMGIGLGMLGIQYGMPAVATLGFAGAFLHVLNHSLFKGLLFLGAGAVAHATGTRNLSQLGGLFQRMPWTGAMFLAGSVAICGLPPFNGFAGEFLLYVGSFKAILGPGAIALGGMAGILSLALIGGLAVAGFTQVFGIAFLGEPRSPAAASAHEVEATMRGPMVVLAALCLGIGLGAGGVVRFMSPAIERLAGVAPAPTGLAGLEATGVLFPVAWIVASLLLIGLVIALAILRRRLLAHRPVRQTVTWDCGYAAPAPSMQYTAHSYVQPLTHGAKDILRSEQAFRAPTGIYPAAASHGSTTPDAAHRYLFAPLFAWAANLFSQLRPLQHGQVHLYILYIAVTLIVLLAWTLHS